MINYVRHLLISPESMQNLGKSTVMTKYLYNNKNQLISSQIFPTYNLIRLITYTLTRTALIIKQTALTQNSDININSNIHS